MRLSKAWTVTQQAARHRILADGSGPGDIMARRQCGQLNSGREKEPVGGDEQRPGPLVDEAGEGSLKISVAARVDEQEALPDRACCGLQILPLDLGQWARRICENPNEVCTGYQFA